MLFKLTDVFVLHLELGDIPRKFSVLGVPAGSGLPGIFQLKDRIKDRLLRQTRRKGFHAAVINQHQFLQTNGTIQNHILILSAFVYNTTCLPEVWAQRVCLRTGRGTLYKGMPTYGCE